MLDQSPPSSLLRCFTAPLHSPGQPPLTLHYVLSINFSTSSCLQGPDTPSHTDDTDNHGHPAGGTSERSVDSLNPHASSVRGPVGIQGDSVRDNGPIDGCLVLLVVQDCSSGDSDCGLRGGTTKSARDLSKSKKGRTLCYWRSRWLRSSFHLLGRTSLSVSYRSTSMVES